MSVFMAELWSDYTDLLITEIDKGIGTKYKFSLKALLSDPTKYMTQPNIQIAISNMKEDVDNYFNGKIKALAEEQKNLDDAASKADSITGQLSRNIVSQARQANVPVIKPVAIERDMARDMNIYINTVDNDIMSLIQKLVLSSVLVADLSTSYNNYKIGSWLFGGNRNYRLNVYMPDSPLLMLDASRAELNNLLMSASDFVKGL